MEQKYVFAELLLFVYMLNLGSVLFTLCDILIGTLSAEVNALHMYRAQWQAIAIAEQEDMRTGA